MAGQIKTESSATTTNVAEEKKPEYKSLYGFSKDNSQVLLYCLAEGGIVPTVPNTPTLEDRDILQFIVNMKRK